MFYLLTIGGSGTNDVGNAYTVTGLGITDAAKIMYRMETVYMSSTTNYAGARTGAIQSATDLYGVNSQQVRSTTNAFHAVNVGAAHPSGARVSAEEETTLVENAPEIQINTYPNPSKDLVEIKLEGEADANLEVMLIDEMGRVRFEKFNSLTDGTNAFKIDVHKLPIGKYNLRAVKTNKNGSKVVIKSLILGN